MVKRGTAGSGLTYEDAGEHELMVFLIAGGSTGLSIYRKGRGAESGTAWAAQSLGRLHVEHAAAEDGEVDIPETRYAKTVDGVHIAYRAIGAGSIDLVWAPGTVSQVELIGRSRDSFVSSDA